MTWKLAGFFARCEGVWPSSRADRLWERVGSWEDGLLSQVWEGCVQEQGFGLEEYVALGP